MITQIGLSLVLALALAGAGAGLYLEGKKAGRNAQIAQQAALEHVARAAAEQTAHIAAAAISKIKVQRTTIQNEVQREILERPVYRDCLHSPDQLRRINEALTGAERPEPAGRGLVPRADAALGSDVRRDDGEAGRGGGAVPGVPGGSAR